MLNDKVCICPRLPHYVRNDRALYISKQSCDIFLKIFIRWGECFEFIDSKSHNIIGIVECLCFTRSSFAMIHQPESISFIVEGRSDIIVNQFWVFDLKSDFFFYFFGEVLF